MSTHPSVKMTTLDGNVVEIDEMLAPVIGELWRAGIDTQVCCQDAAAPAKARGDDPGHVAYYDGYAYIEFFGAEDASSFLTVLANEGPRGKFYDRMSHWSCPGAWRKTISFYDGDFRPWSRSEYREFEPSSVKIAFPVTDIKEIVRRLRRHNRATEG